MLRWKAAQALQFANTQQNQTEKKQEIDGDEDADEQDDDAIWENKGILVSWGVIYTVFLCASGVGWK